MKNNYIKQKKKKKKHHHTSDDWSSKNLIMTIDVP